MFVTTLRTFGLREGDAIGLKPDELAKFKENPLSDVAEKKRIPLHLTRQHSHYDPQAIAT